MDRRTLIGLISTAPLTAALAGVPAVAQDQVLVEVSKYLNQLRTIQGRFTQVNPNGSRSGGTYFMQRPGKIRFEYGSGDALVLADGINVGVFDPKSSIVVQKYPLRTTPLKFLLRERIDLTERNLSRGTQSRDGFTYVFLQDPGAPRDGSMTLKLQNRPPTLREWTVEDKTGQKTKVMLDTLEPASGLNQRLFNIEWTARQIERNR